MEKQVLVLLGTGSIGVAIARRVGVEHHVLLADYNEENAQKAARQMSDAGFECSTTTCDLGSRDSIRQLAAHAQSLGAVHRLVCAAGVSPSQAPVAQILTVDLYGTAVLLETFGQIVAPNGSGLVVSSQSGHRLPALPEAQNEALATTPCDDLLQLPFLQAIDDTLKAYQYSKRCNVLRVMYEATRWAKRGATLNSVSPGIIITPLANDELRGPRGDGYRKMIDGSPMHRAGTPDEVGALAAFLMSEQGRFVTGTDILIDGGTTASYHYGDLQYLKATH
ncbi:MAG: SDR family oxidoreductase [Bacteroidales bacterium]|nr:SDR family oxidoreductase [Bacteroidales bacterium]